MAEKSENNLNLFDFSWGKFAAGLGVLGLIAALFDFETLAIMFKMFFYTVVIPIVGIAAALMCTWSPTRALFWAVFDGVITNFNEKAEELYAKAGIRPESTDSGDSQQQASA